MRGPAAPWPAARPGTTRDLAVCGSCRWRISSWPSWSGRAASPSFTFATVRTCSARMLLRWTGTTWRDMRMSSASKGSSLDFALRPPDPGQLALDERVRDMYPAERAEFAYRLRRQALVLVNRAADAAGTMPELDRAIFVLRRLYPEFTEAQLAH